MHSEFGDKFNHDPWAARYDEDVRNESHPIRAGYGAVLDFVAQSCPQTPGANILDIGIGTGNLTSRLSKQVQVVGLDLSQEMMALAQRKLADGPPVTYVIGDLLAYFEGEHPKFDGIISTYVIHHLTEKEKSRFFEHCWKTLKPGGKAVFGDLMFADLQARQQAIDKFNAEGWEDVALDIDDEFFWLVDSAEAQLKAVGFEVSTRQFSELSWVITAEKPL